MTEDVSKLSRLLDDREVQVMVYGLSHVDPAGPEAQAGAERLREILLRLANSTTRDQYHSWLSDDRSNHPMTLPQVRAALGEDALNGLALFARISPHDVAYQLAAILPDLVDAVSPGGIILDAKELGQALTAALAEDD